MRCNSRVQDLYALLKAREVCSAHAALAGTPADPEVRFEEDLYTPFYGGRQFSISDINGVSLIFWQPDWLSSSSS